MNVYKAAAGRRGYGQLRPNSSLQLRPGGRAVPAHAPTTGWVKPSRHCAHKALGLGGNHKKHFCDFFFMKKVGIIKDYA